MKKLVEVANSSDNLDNVKSRFLQMVGELLDEFPKHNFKDELEKINSQPKLFQIITKKNFQKKEFTFSDLFTDDVNEVIKELQHNSDSGMIGFVSKRFRVSDYEKILLCILNSTVFYNYFYYDGYLQDQTVSAFQKAFRTRFQNVDYIFSSFQKNILKFCPRLSDWVYNSEFKQTNQRLSQESNVKVLDEDFFNLF